MFEHFQHDSDIVSNQVLVNSTANSIIDLFKERCLLCNVIENSNKMLLTSEQLIVDISRLVQNYELRAPR